MAGSLPPHRLRCSQGGSLGGLTGITGILGAAYKTYSEYQKRKEDREQKEADKKEMVGHVSTAVATALAAAANQPQGIATSGEAVASSLPRSNKVLPIVE